MVDIDSLISYMHCGLKYEFSQQSKRTKYVDSGQLFNIILSGTYKYFLHRAGENKRTSPKHLRSKFSILWDKIKSSSSLDPDWDMLISLQNEVDKIPEILGPQDSIIAVNYPVGLDIKNVRVNGTVDAIILRESKKVGSKNLHIICFDHNAGGRRSSISPEIVLKAGFFDMCLRESELRYEKLEIIYSFLRLYGATVQNIKPDRGHKPKVLNTLKALIAGIENEIFFPRPDNYMCKSCLFSPDCSWSCV